MTHTFGKKSQGFMVGMHPVAIQVFEGAIEISPVDFGFTERQVRDLAYQRTLVTRGVSQTLKSNHLEQVDLTGKSNFLYGHAGDAVPYVDGKFVWDWNPIYTIAAAVAESARRLGVLDKTCWGGVWDRWMSEYCGAVPPVGANMDEFLTHQAAIIRRAEADYCVRHPGKDFVDGPHFQFFKKG